MKLILKVLFCLFLFSSCENVNKSDTKESEKKDTKIEKILSDSLNLKIKNHKKDFYDFWINMSKKEYHHVNTKLADEQNSA